MAHTFQGMLSALQAYWEEQGCTIMQPVSYTHLTLPTICSV